MTFTVTSFFGSVTFTESPAFLPIIAFAIGDSELIVKDSSFSNPIVYLPLSLSISSITVFPT